MSETEEQPLTTKKNFLCGVCEGFYGKPWTLEQRHELFSRMQRFGMSTYLYAPKDDYKHRLYWRELYCQEETDELRMLIESAKQHNINFVYALSPGLDIVYSNPEDVAVLKMKLDQVKNLGCLHFALLFDDIEDELSGEDSSNFLSIAHAQCSVTNDMYQYLGEPDLFLFCPTEYCTSRTVPDMAKSLYLQTIGNKLAANIDFLWTGPRVVSRHITVESIKEVTDIVKRPVTIWDNLHANDYDQTRLYLGPYDGRPTELVAHLRGVLTNPNCEFEANFVAMHTLAQWSKNSCIRFPAPASHDDLDMETEDEEEEGDVPENEEEDADDDEDGGEKPPLLYCPKKALVMAVTDWLPELYKTKKSTGTAKVQQSRERDGNHGDDDSKRKKSDKNSHSPESKKRFDPLTVMDVILLCDLFYLPYEHGPQAIQLLQSARWLISNFGLLVDQPGKRFMSRGRIEWYDKAIHFHDCYTNLSIVVDRFVNIPNRELLYELYSYVNDMRSNLALVNSYVKWHGIDKPEKEPFKSGEQEPWVHRGGLLAEFRRLLPIERNNDGLGGKLLDLASHSYIIRQYFQADKDEVYAVCLKTFDDRMDASDVLSAFPQLPGDYLVGFLLEHHPQHCFIVEDESGVCGYAVVAPSARDYYRSMAEDWMPELRKKYPQPEAKELEATTDGATRQLTLEAVLKQMNGVLPVVGDDVVTKYPGFIELTIMPGRVIGSGGSGGRSVGKSLMRAVTKTLTGGGGGGSADDDGVRGGLHTVIPIDNHAELEFYYGLGFTDVTDSCTHLDVSWIVLALAVDA